MNFKNKNILITGGLGFIGSNLAVRLVAQGAEVTIVDSLIPEYGGNLFNIETIRNDVSVNISDVRDTHSMKHIIQGQDYLFNLAGQTSHMDSMENPFTDLEINATAQLSILETCRHYNPDIKIVFASTRQLYGKPQYLPVDEKHPVNPVDVNGINKAAGEQYHLLYNNVYGIRTTILRLTNTYGPHMRVKDARQTFLGIWVRRLVEGNGFEVWGGEQRRDFTYVDDAVDALMIATESEEANGNIYNLGGCEVVNLRQAAEMLVDAGGGGEFDMCKFPDERKKIDIGDFYSDDARIRNELGWLPKVDLAEGLKKTVEYYRDNLQKYI